MLPNCANLSPKEIEGAAMRVVIGAGADALRAAASLSVAGHSVLLLQESGTEHGLTHPDLPEGTGRLSVPSELRSQVEKVTGPLVDAPSIRRAVSRSGRIAQLPMAVGDVPKLFPSDDLADVGRQFFQQRLRNALIPLTGGGQEERTYRQWVERRMGQPAFAHAYSHYAERRWGLPGDDLSVAVARLHHNPHGVVGTTVLGGNGVESLERLSSLIRESGGEIRCGANVRGFKVDEGRVVAVRVGRRNIAIEGPVWVARPHSVVADWLGDALGKGARVDARTLQTLDRVQVAFETRTTLAADEIHILDEVAPAWRVSQVYGAGQTAVFHMNLGPDERPPDLNDLVALGASLGLSDLDVGSARIERLKDWVPVWAPVVHPRLRRLSLAFAELGVVAVGRRGTFSPLDVGAEVLLATRYSDETSPDQREALRAMLAPPIRDDDLSASFRDFLWR